MWQLTCWQIFSPLCIYKKTLLGSQRKKIVSFQDLSQHTFIEGGITYTTLFCHLTQATTLPRGGHCWMKILTKQLSSAGLSLAVLSGGSSFQEWNSHSNKSLRLSSPRQSSSHARGLSYILIHGHLNCVLVWSRWKDYFCFSFIGSGERERENVSE